MLIGTLILSIRVLVNSRLLARFLGSQKLYLNSLLHEESAPLAPTLFKGNCNSFLLYFPKEMLHHGLDGRQEQIMAVTLMECLLCMCQFLCKMEIKNRKTRKQQIWLFPNLVFPFGWGTLNQTRNYRQQEVCLVLHNLTTCVLLVQLELNFQGFTEDEIRKVSSI